MNYTQKLKVFLEKFFILFLVTFTYNQTFNKLHAENIKFSDEKGEFNFKTLPKVKDLKKQNSTGKLDIFSFGDSSTNLTLSLKLIGIFESQNDIYAIVNYNDEIGEIKKGNKGGKDTKYLPNNFKLVNIDLKKFSIIVKSKNKFYEIKG